MSEELSHVISPVGEVEKLSILIENDAGKTQENDEVWLESILKGENESKHGNAEMDFQKIRKVPSIFREVKTNRKCFDPLVVSIGPYHHGKPELKLIESHKSSMASQYVNGSNQSPIVVYKKVMQVVGHARKCYDKGSTNTFDDRAFARMMFLDGCFVIQFIHGLLFNPEDLKMGDRDKAFVRRDLLLFENQLPFRVLEVLMSFRFKENEWKKMLIDFFRPPHSEKEKIQVEDKPAHLLDFLRSILIDKGKVNKSFRSRNDWYSYRSAKELDSIGINFRRDKSHRFTDVSFKPFFLQGLLVLPPITIDDFTKSMLLNLVAYEACPDVPNDFGISSYICLMGSLIDHAEDVKELRRKGIIFNLLGNDEQVAELFTGMSDNLVPNPHAYADVKEKIQMHYKNKVKIWVAEWLHTHFTSPWTLLASSAAVFALVLSTIQTYWTVFDIGDNSTQCICNVTSH